MSARLMDTNPTQPGIPGPETPPGESLPLPSLASLTVSRRENPLRAVFVGPEGMYPGTRWLIYLLIGGLTFEILASLAQVVRPPQTPAWWGLVSQVVVVLSAILPAFVMALIEGRPFGDFGLCWRHAFRRNFWIGTLWGILGLTVLMLALRIAGAFSFGRLALHGTRIAKWGLYYAVFFLLTGFFEEFMLRGYSQWVLTKGMRFWPAAALLSAGFGALHSGNQGETKVGLVAAGLIGFFFCLTLRRTGDLWWAIGFHMSWDWGESYLYSVPDSGGMLPGHLLNSSFQGPEWLTGGSVGPEGSLLVFAVIGAMWVLFDRMYPEVNYPE